MVYQCEQCLLLESVIVNLYPVIFNIDKHISLYQLILLQYLVWFKLPENIYLNFQAIYSYQCAICKICKQISERFR